MCLYEKVKALCEEKGVTIYQMCKEIGMGQNVVSNWKERKNTLPKLDTAVKMADFFGVSVDYFLKE